MVLMGCVRGAVARMGGLMALFCMLSICGAQRWKQKTAAHDPEEHHHERTCSNMTQVLDNWKFAIMSQVKDLLVHDHSSLLPDYSRIQPLSEALADLYRQFNSLKNELAGLMTKFDGVEAFVDELQAGKFVPPPLYPVPAIPPQIGLSAAVRSKTGPNRSIVSPLRTRTGPNRSNVSPLRTRTGPNRGSVSPLSTKAGTYRNNMSPLMAVRRRRMRAFPRT